MLTFVRFQSLGDFTIKLMHFDLIFEVKKSVWFNNRTSTVMHIMKEL